MSLPWPRVTDHEVEENFRAVDATLTKLSQAIFFGTGVPTFTPLGRALYLRYDGGAGTTLYVWEGAAWVGK